MLVLAFVLLIAGTAVSLENISFSGAQGIIYSPGYPGDYGNQLNQYYVITVDQGYYIRLTLYDFETEACCDKLYMWNGVDTTQSTIANVSGDATGQVFSSTGPVMMLLFSTDITGQDRGFAIHYEMVLANTEYEAPNTCQSGLVTSGMGFVTSPEWPSSYPNDITCDYLMAMPKGRTCIIGNRSGKQTDRTPTGRDYSRCWAIWILTPGYVFLKASYH
ncbi:CUB domain protein [Necator americanus]|uniref:CUB domain protein n=1 Tax=Necator americanus TaxID=51031 RepID=W2SZ93_NECAM|nr:CUB domain protein [Necator americanus]ETN74017.1 CUB domain protein [Necator americanus]